MLSGIVFSPESQLNELYFEKFKAIIGDIIELNNVDKNHIVFVPALISEEQTSAILKKELAGKVLVTFFLTPNALKKIQHKLEDRSIKNIITLYYSEQLEDMEALCDSFLYEEFAQGIFAENME